jgi:hypothetical protein
VRAPVPEAAPKGAATEESVIEGGAGGGRDAAEGAD